MGRKQLNQSFWTVISPACCGSVGFVGLESDACVPGASGRRRVFIARHIIAPSYTQEAYVLTLAHCVAGPCTFSPTHYLRASILLGPLQGTDYPLLPVVRVGGSFAVRVFYSISSPNRLANAGLASDVALLGASVLLSLSGVGGAPLAIGALLFAASLSRASVTDLGRLALLVALLWLEYSMPRTE
jgi:hypothetical protein